MKTIAIIQARMGSERFPGKILAPLSGQPLLKVLVERIRSAAVDEIWLATTEEPADNLTAEWGRALGLKVYRGSTDDVLSRFTGIVRQTKPDWVFRLTADNPFTHADVLDALAAQATKADPATELIAFEKGSGSPLGFSSVSLVRAEALLRSEAAIPADEDYHRTHVTSWTVAKGKVQRIPEPAAWPARPDWRWTVDTPEDYAMAQKAFAQFGGDWATIRYPEMAEKLDAHPEITSINGSIQQKSLEEG